MAEKTKTAIDEAFEEFESTVGSNKTVRKEMIESLRKALANPEMAPSPYDKAMAMQAKVAVYKTLDDLLKSEEDVSLRKLKMRLARKDSETNGMVGQTMVALLKSIRATGELVGQGQGVDHDQAMNALREKQAAGGKELEISQGELEECATSPTTDGSGSPLPETKSDEDEEE